MNLAIIYDETMRVKHIEFEIIRIYADEGAACTILNIELQKHPPSRHRGNYYACGHRGLCTNNSELRIEREEGKGDRERIGNAHFFIVHVRQPSRKSNKFS